VAEAAESARLAAAANDPCVLATHAPLEAHDRLPGHDESPASPSTGRWECFSTFYDPLAAHIVAGRLNVEGVPAIVEAWSRLDFTWACEVWVPSELAHRARWIMAWEPPSEAELTFLATGELE